MSSGVSWSSGRVAERRAPRAGRCCAGTSRRCSVRSRASWIGSHRSVRYSPSVSFSLDHRLAVVAALDQLGQQLLGVGPSRARRDPAAPVLAGRRVRRRRRRRRTTSCPSSGCVPRISVPFGSIPKGTPGSDAGPIPRRPTGIRRCAIDDTHREPEGRRLSRRPRPPASADATSPSDGRATAAVPSRGVPDQAVASPSQPAQ